MASLIIIKILFLFIVFSLASESIKHSINVVFGGKLFDCLFTGIRYSNVDDEEISQISGLNSSETVGGSMSDADGSISHDCEMDRYWQVIISAIGHCLTICDMVLICLILLYIIDLSMIKMVEIMFVYLIITIVQKINYILIFDLLIVKIFYQLRNERRASIRELERNANDHDYERQQGQNPSHCQRQREK